MFAPLIQISPIWPSGSSVAVSAFVALSLSPMLAARVLKPIKEGHKKLFFLRWFDAILGWFTRLYGAVLRGLVHATSFVLRPFLALGWFGRVVAFILTLAALKGFFDAISDEPVSYVNAPQLAVQKGIDVRESRSASSPDYVNLVTLRAGTHSIAATLVGQRRQARIVLVDDHITDVPPSDHMLVVRNDDRPGVIGLVGTLLGNHNVNIADMDVGRALTPGTALMVIAPTAEVTEDVQNELRAAPGIIEVIALRG